MREAGFTLIELMIAMVIIGILATIAYPAYTGYVQDARRAEAKAMLFDAAQTLERRYTANSSYCEDGACNDFSGLSLDTEFYSIDNETSELNPTEYKLVAVPEGAQSNDECGNLILMQTGERSSAGDGNDCW